ncbi:ATP-binding protein [Megasphaera sp.]|jgi:predicted AAA+ superfamily ATPase|uniref:ATP-binding protein n=1 Tax=Megasphaera sp. TaxID=2023260 RepID=UPI0025BBA37D|nr:ATP-binding protein [Megasphaera sp.]MCF0153556.1 ATP-binding protein [Megasphaera sp.]
MFLKRKIASWLVDWKRDPERLPLIVKGARQIGKTESIRHFGKTQYKNYIEINFILQKQYQSIFDDGFDVDQIIKNITFINPSIRVTPHETLIFFDEIQACINGATSLKAFKLDGRYDVICSGSLMGINYQEIESNSVGYKQDYVMYSLDFEEFLWAKGYQECQIEDIYQHMQEIQPLSASQMQALRAVFGEYMVVGGMPAIVSRFIRQNDYSGILQMQQQILIDYEEDITKYAGGLDKTKILNVYRAIPVFLGKSNKKFQISKVAHGARNRSYVGVVEWLENAGIVNICYNLEMPELPLKGNYNPTDYKLYFGDPGLLIGSLDEEAQQDLRNNRNFNIYKGAIYENVVSDMLKKQGYPLFFYKNTKATVEMDFMVRDMYSLIPIEVKAKNGSTISLHKMITKDSYADIHYGIKLGNLNIGFNGEFYTFPYFLTFLLKRFLSERMM